MAGAILLVVAVQVLSLLVPFQATHVYEVELSAVLPNIPEPGSEALNTTGMALHVYEPRTSLGEAFEYQSFFAVGMMISATPDMANKVVCSWTEVDVERVTLLNGALVGSDGYSCPVGDVLDSMNLSRDELMNFKVYVEAYVDAPDLTIYEDTHATRDQTNKMPPLSFWGVTLDETTTPLLNVDTPYVWPWASYAAHAVHVDAHYGNAPLTVQFDASGMIMEGGRADPPAEADAREFAWDWDGDGEVDEVTLTPVVSHTFATRTNVSVTVDEAHEQCYNGACGPRPAVVIDIVPGSQVVELVVAQSIDTCDPIFTVPMLTAVDARLLSTNVELLSEDVYGYHCDGTNAFYVVKLLLHSDAVDSADAYASGLLDSLRAFDIAPGAAATVLCAYVGEPASDHACVSGATTPAGSDDYVFSTMTYDFDDIRATGSALPVLSAQQQKPDLSAVDRLTALDLGFDVEFYGETYSVIYVSPNGYFSFQPWLEAPQDVGAEPFGMHVFADHNLVNMFRSHGSTALVGGGGGGVDIVLELPREFGGGKINELVDENEVIVSPYGYRQNMVLSGSVRAAVSVFHSDFMRRWRDRGEFPASAGPVQFERRDGMMIVQWTYTPESFGKLVSEPVAFQAKIMADGRIELHYEHAHFQLQSGGMTREEHAARVATALVEGDDGVEGDRLPGEEIGEEVVAEVVLTPVGMTSANSTNSARIGVTSQDGLRRVSWLHQETVTDYTGFAPRGDSFGDAWGAHHPLHHVALCLAPPPQAKLVADVTGGREPLTVRFDASQSVPGVCGDDSNALTYVWDFGDGSDPVEGASIVEHTFTSAQTFTTVVTVTDRRGATSSASVDVSSGRRLVELVKKPHLGVDTDTEEVVLRNIDIELVPALGSVLGVAGAQVDIVDSLWHDQLSERTIIWLKDGSGLNPSCDEAVDTLIAEVLAGNSELRDLRVLSVIVDGETYSMAPVLESPRAFAMSYASLDWDTPSPAAQHVDRFTHHANTRYPIPFDFSFGGENAPVLIAGAQPMLHFVGLVETALRTEMDIKAHVPPFASEAAALLSALSFTYDDTVSAAEQLESSAWLFEHLGNNAWVPLLTIETLGEAPYRRLVLTWQNVLVSKYFEHPETLPDTHMDVQIKLFETTNRIEMHYRGLQVPDIDMFIGVRMPFGDAGLDYLWHTGNSTHVYPSPSDFALCLAPSSGVAVATSDVQFGSAPLTVRFDGMASSASWCGGHVDTYEWDFGDLTGTSSESAPEHTFSSAGTYTVSLTTTDDRDVTARTTMQVHVGQESLYLTYKDVNDYPIVFAAPLLDPETSKGRGITDRHEGGDDDNAPAARRRRRLEEHVAWLAEHGEERTAERAAARAARRAAHHAQRDAKREARRARMDAARRSAMAPPSKPLHARSVVPPKRHVEAVLLLEDTEFLDVPTTLTYPPSWEPLPLTVRWEAPSNWQGRTGVLGVFPVGACHVGLLDSCGVGFISVAANEGLRGVATFDMAFLDNTTPDIEVRMYDDRSGMLMARSSPIRVVHRSGYDFTVDRHVLWYNEDSWELNADIQLPVHDVIAYSFSKPAADDLASGSYVQVFHHSSLNLGTEFTMEAWVRPDPAAESGMVDMTIFSKGHGTNLAATPYVFGLRVDVDAGTFSPRVLVRDAWREGTSFAAELGGWVHVAVTLNSLNNEVLFFVNGVVRTSVPSVTGHIDPDTSSLLVGVQGTDCQCNWMEGEIREVRLFGEQRTHLQIKADMERIGEEGSELLYLGLQDGTGGDGATLQTFFNGAPAVLRENDENSEWTEDLDGDYLDVVEIRTGHGAMWHDWLDAEEWAEVSTAMVYEPYYAESTSFYLCLSAETYRATAYFPRCVARTELIYYTPMDSRELTLGRINDAVLGLPVADVEDLPVRLVWDRMVATGMAHEAMLIVSDSDGGTATSVLWDALAQPDGDVRDALATFDVFGVRIGTQGFQHWLAPLQQGGGDEGEGGGGDEPIVLVKRAVEDEAEETLAELDNVAILLRQPRFVAMDAQARAVDVSMEAGGRRVELPFTPRLGDMPALGTNAIDMMVALDSPLVARTRGAPVGLDMVSAADGMAGPSYSGGSFGRFASQPATARVGVGAYRVRVDDDDTGVVMFANGLPFSQGPGTETVQVSYRHDTGVWRVDQERAGYPFRKQPNTRAQGLVAIPGVLDKMYAESSPDSPRTWYEDEWVTGNTEVPYAVSLVRSNMCGNGVREAGEECDDENLQTGDGCDAACAVEAGYVCPYTGYPLDEAVCVGEVIAPDWAGDCNVHVLADAPDAFTFDGQDVSLASTSAPTPVCGGSSITKTWRVAFPPQEVTQVVQVRDADPPAFNVQPASNTLECGVSTTTSAQGQAQATDVCWGGTAVEFSDDMANTCGNAGTLTRTWTATDACDNVGTYVQTLVIEDTLPPSWDFVPSHTEVECGTSMDPLDINGRPDAFDVCDDEVLPVVEYADESEDPSGCPFVVTRTWSATDRCDNVKTRQQFLTIVDTVGPVFTHVPSDLTLECTADLHANATGWATAEDCHDFALSYSDDVDAGACDGASSIERTWLAVDTCGNAAEAVQTLTLIDTTAPVFVEVPADSTVECELGLSPAVTGGEPVVEDACSSFEVTFSDAEVVGACTGESVVTRTWIARDHCGNEARTDQVVTVVDTTAPLWVFVPDNVTVPCAGGVNTNVTGGVANATDACGGGVDIWFDDVREDGECAGTHIIFRHWYARDECGNVASVVQRIDVVDEVGPTFVVVPPDTTVDCGDGVATTETGGVATADDHCSSVASVDFEDVNQPADLCAARVRMTRRWTARDTCGNPTTHDQFVTIRAVPTIDRLSQTHGKQGGGSVITIHGTNFGRATDTFSREVRVGGRVCPITAVTSNEEMECTTQSDATKRGVLVDPPPVEIVVDGVGGTVNPAIQWTWLEPPRVVAIQPNEGSVLGGTKITLLGENFGVAGVPPAFDIRVDGEPCEDAEAVTRNGMDGIICRTTNEGGKRGYPVHVSTEVDGVSANVGTWRWLDVPVVEDVVPRAGTNQAGTFVSVIGENFDQGGNETTIEVIVGGAYCVGPEMSNNRTITCTTSSEAAPSSSQRRRVEVNVNGVRSPRTDLQYYFMEAPTIKRIEPTSASILGGEQVTIIGFDLGPAVNPPRRSVVLDTINCVDVHRVEAEIAGDQALVCTTIRHKHVTKKNGHVVLTVDGVEGRLESSFLWVDPSDTGRGGEILAATLAMVGGLACVYVIQKRLRRKAEIVPKEDVFEVEEVDMEAEKVAHPRGMEREWMVGDTCMAQYSADDLWYRAELKEIDTEQGMVLVRFLDYDDFEWTSLTAVQPMPQLFAREDNVAALAAAAAAAPLANDAGADHYERLDTASNSSESGGSGSGGDGGDSGGGSGGGGDDTVALTAATMSKYGSRVAVQRALEETMQRESNIETWQRNREMENLQASMQSPV